MALADVRRRIEALETLSSPPGSVDRILTLAADPESHVHDLAQAIQTDPAIAARLLRLANSAYFGFPARIASVSKAIVVLGYRTVQNLAACVALAPAFRAEASSLDRRQVWLHSCAVAEATRLLALERSEDAPTAYLAGLLHDLGQVALEEAAPKAYASVADEAQRGTRPLREIERERIGLDHAEAGALLAELWRLPEVLREAIAVHEDAAEAGPIAQLVRAGEHLAGLEALDGAPQDGPAEASAEAASRLAGLDRERIEAVLERFKQRREALELLHRESWKGGE